MFLRDVVYLVCQPLSVLFQKSLIEGIVPSQWLKACITAIHKKGAKHLFENYRPISITSNICKLMESIMRDKVLGHMEFNQVFEWNKFMLFLRQYDKSFVMYGRLDKLHWRWTPNIYIYRFCEIVRPCSSSTSLAENQEFRNSWDDS